ncbi:MAG: S49 family peptidase [Bosea sp.]|uniref:S49 family peptidase n=1 Tax=unclassified Bosea (in: a-proteobacteria) TaxID=2653178 RepID=UPI000968CEC0|nr:MULTISPECIES: S49 family peptidase [unclassified Bosea (in: a-proteobacteria)]MBN9459051.1 S49 family peptidase [Bosea sp. (in: a-proteobacteria)]OJV06209.1 MAG: hypothetical protein BGO20_08100 [Bosea sp. 67-29]
MSEGLFRIADLAFNRPLLIEHEAAAIAASVLLPRIGAETIVDLPADPQSVEASAFVGTPVYRADGRFAGYRMAGDGVAIVPMRGKLVNRGAYIGASSGLTSYEGMQAVFNAVRNDNQVRAVVIDEDSPGGQASGAFETADLVRQLNAEKPVVSFVNSLACSAAYLIGAAAGEIVLTPTASVGSIGVIFIHLDRSGEMAKAGVRPTIVHAGAGKPDGNPFEPLPEAVRADVQREVDGLYAEFVSAVASYRGSRLTEDRVRALGARVYRGRAAVEAGLADRVATLDDVVAQLSSPNRRPGGSQQKGSRMSATEKTEPGGDAGISQAEHNTAVTAARQEGQQAGLAEGRAQEKTRLKAIMTCDAAKPRQAAALALALETDVSAEQAASVLAATPEAGKSGLGQLMAGVTEADLGTGAAPQKPETNALAARMAKRFGKN